MTSGLARFVSYFLANVTDPEILGPVGVQPPLTKASGYRLRLRAPPWLSREAFQLATLSNAHSQRPHTSAGVIVSEG